MENRKILSMKKIITPLSIILFAVLLRLIPHPANFAPIAGMALFGSVYLNKKYALIVPLIAMFISDLFIGFHSTILFVYGSFLLSGLIGIWIRQHKTVQNVILGVLTSSVLFFVITNFGVWLVGSLYSKTFLGLVQCYVYAIPFFRNTLMGDLFYTGVFFGSFELIKNVILSETRNPIKVKRDSLLRLE